MSEKEENRQSGIPDEMEKTAESVKRYVEDSYDSQKISGGWYNEEKIAKELEERRKRLEDEHKKFKEQWANIRENMTIEMLKWTFDCKTDAELLKEVRSAHSYFSGTGNSYKMRTAEEYKKDKEIEQKMEMKRFSLYVILNCKDFADEKNGNFELGEKLSEMRRKLEAKEKIAQNSEEQQKAQETAHETSGQPVPEKEGKKLYTSADLQFSPALHREYNTKTGEPIDRVREQAVMQFDNGWGMAITKSDNPNRKEYGIAILDKDGKKTCATEITACGLICVDGEDLNALMKDVQNLDEDGCIKGKELTERGKELKLIGACERGDVNTVKNIINGGVNINMNIINVKMGDSYLQDSLLDRANGNRDIIGILQNAGIDMDKIQERTENRRRENKDTKYEEPAIQRLDWLKDIREGMKKGVFLAGEHISAAIANIRRKLAEHQNKQGMVIDITPKPKLLPSSQQQGRQLSSSGSKALMPDRIIPAAPKSSSNSGGKPALPIMVSKDSGR